MSAAKHLTAACPVLATLIARVGPLKISRPDYAQPYEALISAVAHQQLHGKAAMTILGRLQTLGNGAVPPPAALLALSDESLRACGFSGAKIRALRDIALHAAEGAIPSRAQARRLSDAALIERLTAIRGVGQWTVEMLLIFTLRRPDVFPVDDFGVREGYRLIHGLDAQPKPKTFAKIGELYAPHRSTAALYLWRACDLAKPPKPKGPK
jgi:DNA-3-methyladenine glycosylase II